MLPLIVGEVADRRAGQVAGDRAVAAALVAVAGRATPEEDRPTLRQQRVAGHLGRRGGGGWLSRRKATNPPAIRPSIIRKISRETAGSMAETNESGGRWVVVGQGSGSRGLNGRSHGC